MLINLKIENYKSYKEVSELSLVSNSKIRVLKDHEAKVNNLSIIKNCGIFGGNASGKSNIIKAISFIKSLIIDDNTIIYDLAFKNCEKKPTKFIITFSSTNNEIFEYSFSIIKNNDLFNSFNVIKESLYKINYSSVELIYSYLNNSFSLHKELMNDTAFNTYIDGFKNLNGKLFLSYINESDKLINDEKIKMYIKEAFNFFKNDINIISLDSNTFNLINTNNIKTISKYLQEYDTGISDLEFVECPVNEICKIFPIDVLNKYVRDVQCKGVKHFSIFNNKELVQFNLNNDGIVANRLVSKHKNINAPFNFYDESDGTKRIMYLISILLANNQSNKVYFIDEIERSLHPTLCEKLLKDFQAINKNLNSQIIFTTHQVSIMDNILRRDEIYFCEKDNLGNSSISSLLEYESRSDSVISKKYLEGRFGAVPNLKVNINN